MINKNIHKEDVLKALAFIESKGVPANRHSKKFDLSCNGKLYPPKYVLSIAAKIATKKELEPSQFNGGEETNSYLRRLGFTIVDKNGRVWQTYDTKKKQLKICTAIIQITGDIWDETPNDTKYELLSDILIKLSKSTDLLILPAGYINSNSNRPEKIIEESEQTVKKLIKKHNPNLIICFGIDGRDNKDQLAIALNKNGIVSLGRKFHHMNKEVQLANSPFDLEQNKQRHFQIKNRKPYLAVCYDIYGISQKKLINQCNCDLIIGLIHRFDNTGGDSDFARKGLAGASKQWGVHSYASAVFCDDRDPSNWPSGVKWVHGKASVKDFNYDQIRINCTSKILTTKSAKVHLRYFSE